MKATEAIREIMKVRDVGVMKLANRLNKKQNTVSMILQSENITTGRLVEILRVMDYKVVILPVEVSTPKGGYEIG